MKVWKRLAGVAAAGVLASSAASASMILIVDSNGLLTGANGVLVVLDGVDTLWAVSFRDGTVLSNVPQFANSNQALKASNALADRVFTPFTGQVFDGSALVDRTDYVRYETSPRLTRG